MKYLYFLVLIPFYGNKYLYNLNNCSILTGVYKLSTGERWKLKQTKNSKGKYFVFQCIESDCDIASDQFTFKYLDCDNDPSNGIFVLCPDDDSGNAELTFTNCNSNICNIHSGQHFENVVFHRKGKPNWKGVYDCSEN